MGRISNTEAHLNHPRTKDRPSIEPESPAWPIVSVIVIAALAQWIGGILPILGAPVAALLIGLIIRNAFHVEVKPARVLRFFTRNLLQLAIVLVGATFTFREVALLGQAHLGLIAAVILVTQLGAFIAGRFVGVPRRLATLIGAGTSVCGVTAIMSVGPVIEAEEDETTYAVTTILLFNLLATLLFPFIGRALTLPSETFGAWIGATIHDTSSVLAVAFGHSDEAGQAATVVKLTRTLFLVPLVLFFALARGSEGSGQGQKGWTVAFSAFPKFILAFLALTLLSSAGIIPPALAGVLGKVAKVLITAVLAAVGLSANLSRLKNLGLQPLVLGLVTSVVSAVVSIMILNMTS